MQAKPTNNTLKMFGYNSKGKLNNLHHTATFPLVTMWKKCCSLFDNIKMKQRCAEEYYTA
jgi:hypothetical protein